MRKKPNKNFKSKLNRWKKQNIETMKKFKE